MVRDEKGPSTYLILRRNRGDLRLRVGPALVGRGSSCEVVIAEPRVSRRHAQLTVGSDSAVVEDLGSSNGVYVNGGRITGKRTLRHGDVLRVGGEDMLLLFFTEEEHEQKRREVKTVQRPMIDALVDDHSAEEEPTAPTLEIEGIDELADQILARGSGTDAERMLSSQMADMLKRARAGDLDEALRERTASLAARLAAATEKGTWIDYAIELYSLAGTPPSKEIVELLEAAASLVESIDSDALGTYVRNLRSMQERFGADQLALIDRVEELSHSVGWG